MSATIIDARSPRPGATCIWCGDGFDLLEALQAHIELAHRANEGLPVARVGRLRPAA